MTSSKKILYIILMIIGVSKTLFPSMPSSFVTLDPFVASTVVPVRAVSTTAIASLTGPVSVDGVSLVAGERVLLTAQANGINNGVWLVEVGAWTRPTDFADGDQIAGVFVFVREGVMYTGTSWQCTNDIANDVVGVDVLTWAEYGPQIIGAKSSYNFYNNDFAIVRLTQDGLPDPVLDPSINSNATLPGVITTNFNIVNVENPASRADSDVANSCIITPDRKIVAAGFATIGNGTKKVALARYNPDGSLDTTFNPDIASDIPGLSPGIPGLSVNTLSDADDIGTGIILDDLGNYVVVGDTNGATFTNGFIIRLTPDGLPDQTFNSDGITAGALVFGIENQNVNIKCVTQDGLGRYLVVGTTDFDIFLARITNAGILDVTFNPDGAIPGIVTTSIPDRNAVGWVVITDPTIQKIYVASLIDSDSGIQEIGCLRYNLNGSLDTTFNATGMLIVSSPVLEERALSARLELETLGANIVLNQFGKSVVEGDNNIIQPKLIMTLLRITRQGVLDTTFNPTGQSVVFSPASVMVDQEGQGDEGYTQFSGFEQTLVTDPLLNPLNLAGYESLDISAILNGVPTVISSSIAQFAVAQIPNDVTAGLLIDPNENYIPVGFTNNSNFNNDFNFLRVQRSGAVSTFFNFDTPTADALVIKSNPFRLNTFFDITFIEFGGTSQNLYVSDFAAGQIGDSLFGDRTQLQAIITDPVNAAVFTRTDITFEGLTAPGAHVTLFLNNNPIGSVDADVVGSWRFTTKIPEDGVYSLYVTAASQKYGAENVSTQSKSLYFAVATKLPEQPKITAPIEQATIETNSILFEGTANPGAQVQIFVDNTLVSTAQADEHGKWQTYHYLSNARKFTVQARVIDALGRLSEPSNSVVFNKIFKKTDEIKINSPGFEEIVTTSHPVFSGIGPSNVSIELLVDGNVVGTTQTTMQGAWTYTSKKPFVDRKYIVEANFYDQSQKKKISTQPLEFRIETKAITSSIAKPTLTLDVPLNEQVLLSGQAEPNTIANLFLNRRKLGTVSVSPKGMWSYAIPPLTIKQPGKYPVEVSILDKLNHPLSTSTLFLNFITSET